MRKILPLLLVASFWFSPAAQAGGAHQTNIQGIPYRWETTLTYNVDQGDLKPGVPAYSHDQVLQMIRDAFATWNAALSSGSVSIAEGQELPLAGDGVGSDVDISNFNVYVNSNKMVNPIIFDTDGQILESMLGECAQFSTFAMAGFEQIDPATATVKKGRTIFGGACIPDGSGKTLSKGGCAPCVLSLNDAQVHAMILHELGHLLGMDHSQVNPNSYQSCVAQGACSVKAEDDLPTMFPLIVAGAAMQTLHRDDIAYFNRLYGDPTQDSCTVSGRILGADGQTELRGVEVVARNVDSNLETTDAIAFISGAEAPRKTATGKSQDNCAGHCGDYEITGLTPGESYQLCVQNILPQFQGGAGIQPVDPPAQLISPDCPQSLTVSCTCSGSGCATFPGEDIITQPIDGNGDAFGNISEASPSSAGGCSLMVVPETHAWARLKNLLVFGSRFQ